MLWIEITPNASVTPWASRTRATGLADPFFFLVTVPAGIGSFGIASSPPAGVRVAGHGGAHLGGRAAPAGGPTRSLFGGVRSHTCATWVASSICWISAVYSMTKPDGPMKLGERVLLPGPCRPGPQLTG